MNATPKPIGSISPAAPTLFVEAFGHLRAPSDLPATINIGLTDEVRFVALATLGQIYLDRDEFDSAKILLIRALDLQPAEAGSLANLRFLLGSAFLGGDLADYDEAIWLFTQVLAVEPRSVEALNSRALAYLERDRVGDPGRAIDDLNRAATIRPERAGTHLNLAVGYIERGAVGDLGLAIESLDEAISIQAEYPSAFVNRAAALIARGDADDIDGALQNVKTALEIEPDLPAAYLNRGNAYVARGQMVTCRPLCGSSARPTDLIRPLRRLCSIAPSSTPNLGSWTGRSLTCAAPRRSVRERTSTAGHSASSWLLREAQRREGNSASWPSSTILWDSPGMPWDWPTLSRGESHSRSPTTRHLSSGSTSLPGRTVRAYTWRSGFRG